MLCFDTACVGWHRGQFDYILSVVMGSTVVFLVGFHHLMTRGDLMEKRSLYFAGLAAYFPFPLALYFITDEVTRTPEPSCDSLPSRSAES